MVHLAEAIVFFFLEVVDGGLKVTLVGGKGGLPTSCFVEDVFDVLFEGKVHLEIAVDEMLLVAEVDLKREFLAEQIEEHHSLRIDKIDGTSKDVLKHPVAVFKSQKTHDQRIGAQTMELEVKVRLASAIENS